MELNFFKDKLFDVLNESDNLEVADIKTDERNNIFMIVATEGSIFEIKCRQVK